MEKKNTVLVVLVVILSLLVGALGGYLISDKLGNNNNNNNQTEKPNGEDKNVTPEPSMSAYEKFVLEYKKSMKDVTATSTDKDELNLMPNKQIKSVTLTKDGTATINYFDSSSYKKKYPNGQVLDGKYIILDVESVGNGGFYMYFLVKEDGSVTAINEFSGNGNNELNIEENYNNYKEITSIVDYVHVYNVDTPEYNKYAGLDKNSDGLVFTDINGNTY